VGLIELFLLAVGLSMDAFAVAISLGLTLPRVGIRQGLIVGGYFGVFQAGMPLIGYLTATLFADQIVAYDHWIAFLLLAFLGGRMIREGLKGDDAAGNVTSVAASGSDSVVTDPYTLDLPDKAKTLLSPAQMLPLAVATSIDALAVGVSFAFLRIDIVSAVLFIGTTTLIISACGVKIGSIFGSRYEGRAQLGGGIILVLIGLRILLEHLGIWG